MVDVICYLCRDENLLAPSSALKAPVSVLVSKVSGRVRHVEPSSRYKDKHPLVLSLSLGVRISVIFLDLVLVCS